ncbi:MAG: aerotolerance regulator BatC [Bacteroidaceae bacterium]|nr:aerotolerance regulator BatC [Bacteroidaceae bacterium]
MKLSRYILTVCSLFLCLQLAAQNNDRDCIRMGNKHFRDKEYNKAETWYRKALEMNKTLEAYYNLGNSVAAQGNDSVAFEQYKKALEQIAETSEKKAYVYHNMGNMTYLNGRSLMKANSPDAMKSFQQAVELYKSALRCNPSDDETRYNLAMAQYMLKKNQQNQNQQGQDQNQDQQQNKDQDKKDDQKDKQDQGDQNKDQQKDQDKQDQQNKNQQKQDQQNQDQQKQDQQQKQEQQQQQPQKPQIDDKTAEQLLNSAQQDEKAVQRKVQKAEKAHRQGLEKDW